MDKFAEKYLSRNMYVVVETARAVLCKKFIVRWLKSIKYIDITLTKLIEMYERQNKFIKS